MVMAAEGDLVIGITQIIQGYDPNILLEAPNATMIRWFFTGILQSIMGVFLLVDSFVLSMQSTNVIDLVLNLTALHFIQEVDELAFSLASSGILTKKMKQECELVAEMTHHTTKKYRKSVKLLKRVLIILMAAGLLGPYFYIVALQSEGYYLCDNLYIQFGDAYNPEIAHYSGKFISQGNALNDRKN